jgi:hypothetical protein
MRNFVNRDVNRESVISALGLRLVPRLTDILARLISFWHSERLGQLAGSATQYNL